MVKYEDDQILIRETHVEDCDILAKNLRQEDKNELLNIGQRDYLSIILQSYEVSKGQCYTVFYMGKIAMIYGLRKVNNDGIIWMLSTDEVKYFPKKFLRLAKKFIEEFKDGNVTLYNYICIKNIQSLKLLKYCGADFKEQVVARMTRKPFIKFEIKGNLNV